MKEYFTDAIVLNIKPIDENNNLVDFYTKELGRIKAKVVSGRKILSKLMPHLDVLNLVKLRLVEKKYFIVADVIAEDSFLELKSSPAKLVLALNLVYVLRNIFYETEPDIRLWHWLVRSFRLKRFNYREFLKIIGYDPLAAHCEICGSKEPRYFSIEDQSFVCYRCHTKFPSNTLLYIK